ncbi:hypothetical protein CP8484711_0042B, partial [Chlamydia psittaci 84-8471/1]
TLG